MKKTGILLKLLTGRLLHRKSFVCCLVLIPLLIFSFSVWEREDKTGVKAGVFTEEENEWNVNFLSLLTEPESEIQFIQYRNLKRMTQDIVSGHIECGYILHDDLQNRMENKKWDNAVIVYESPESMLTSVVNEVFFERLFTCVSEEQVEGYVAERAEYREINSGKPEEEFRERLKEREAGGETFEVEYHYAGICPSGGEDSSGEENGSGGKGGSGGEHGVFPFRGMIAMLIFLSGLLGIFDVIKDRKEPVFLRTGRRKAVLFADIAIPVLLAAVFSLISVFFSGKWKGTVEIPAMIVYSIIVIVWCTVFSLFVRNENGMAVCLPVLIIYSLICTPVLIDTGLFSPVFTVLGKWIPTVWYLDFI